MRVGSKVGPFEQRKSMGIKNVKRRYLKKIKLTREDYDCGGFIKSESTRTN